jgi:hypothetical protein
LDPHRAKILAAAKALQIRAQEDYSLAEIYNSSESDAVPSAVPIGFSQ